MQVFLKMGGLFRSNVKPVETRRIVVELYETEIDLLTAKYNREYWQLMEAKISKRVKMLKAEVSKQPSDTLTPSIDN